MEFGHFAGPFGLSFVGSFVANFVDLEIAWAYGNFNPWSLAYLSMRDDALCGPAKVINHGVAAAPGGRKLFGASPRRQRFLIKSELMMGEH